MIGTVFHSIYYCLFLIFIVLSVKPEVTFPGIICCMPLCLYIISLCITLESIQNESVSFNTFNYFSSYIICFAFFVLSASLYIAYVAYAMINDSHSYRGRTYAPRSFIHTLCILYLYIFIVSIFTFYFQQFDIFTFPSSSSWLPNVQLDSSDISETTGTNNFGPFFFSSMATTAIAIQILIFPRKLLTSDVDSRIPLHSSEL